MSRIYNLKAKSNEKNKKAERYIIISVLAVMMIISFSFAFAVSAEDTVVKNDKFQIDFTDSGTTGTVKVNAVEKIDKKLKVEITKGDKKYIYDLNGNGEAESYPFQCGNGEYGIRVMVNVTEKKYSVGLAAKYTLNLKDEYAPYVNANQLVNYTKDSKIVKIAKELASKCETELEKVEAIYTFVIDSLSYDTELASDPPNGYIPDVDKVVDSGKGICFDYASVFAAMLRSQGIPAKLVIGNVKMPDGSVIYHAWNEFYLKDKGGWFKINEMKFDGNKFERVDPTFESNNRNDNKSNKNAIKFIGDGSNYSPSLEY